MFGADGKKFQRQYKNKTIGFKEWNQKSHAEQWLVFPENITSELSIDKVCLSKGELYTLVTSKAGKGQKKSIVAILEGTKAEVVIEHLQKLPKSLRSKVTEITLDMACSMKQITRKCFVNIAQVIDRLHVQKLASEALQNIRIKYRWEEMEKENKGYESAKSQSIKYIPAILSNGDTKKQLLARSRHLLYKSQDKWTVSQQERAQL